MLSRCLICLMGVLLCGSAAWAQDSLQPGASFDAHDDAVPAFDLRTVSHLTGDWGGARTELQDAGITFKLKSVHQFMVNMRGGKETTNGHDTAGSYEVGVHFDFDKMNLVPGGSFFIKGKGTWGGDDSDFDKEKVGAFFKTNQDASAEEPLFIDKWWWAQMLADDRIELRFGRIEAVKDLFDTSEIMGHEDKQFLNRALVRNATIPAKKGLGLYGHFQLTDTFYVRAAAVDAQSEDRKVGLDTAFHDEDWFIFNGELGCKPKLTSDRGELWGHYRVGTWYDPTRKTQFRNTLGGTLVTPTRQGEWGFYVGFDQMVWKESDAPGDTQGIAIASRYGTANGEVSNIEHFWSIAAQYEGFVPGRDKDVLGVGMAQGIFANEYRRVAPDADRETVYEVYYAFHVTPWLTVSPDFQYVVNAGGDESDPNAILAGLRVKVAL